MVKHERNKCSWQRKAHNTRLRYSLLRVNLSYSSDLLPVITLKIYTDVKAEIKVTLWSPTLRYSELFQGFVVFDSAV